MMEISKGLRKEIMLVQNKLKNAIHDHQICMGKLEDNTNNADILRQIEEIRLHIISLGRCQKQVVQRLRKEVESFKAENANGAKVSVASLLGLNHNNNNNNSTNNNNKNNNNKHVVDVDDEEKEEVAQVKVQSNGIFDSRRLSKENYEGVVRNGVITASRKTCANERFRSETSPCAEEDVIEVSDDEKSYEQHEEVEGLDGIEEAPLSEQSKLNSMQVMFLGSLGLITATKFSELQNKRAERKRRSTANPQFVYTNWDIPTKRKRHSYLQSIGNAPQTRQTTARLNGPSPPPSKPLPPKSTSPSNKSSSNSLILAQKATTVRPNILRNVSESQDSVNKVRHENGISELPTANVKSSKAKTMHIPGLPSCLTIERIESDTVVCIYCRNPGTLTFCDNCSISYHASCRSSSPPPSRLCSKCVQSQRDDDLSPTTIIKTDEELAPESSAPGLADKAGKDTEVNKTSGGFYKIDATASARFIPTVNYGISQLPTSTYLIPIASDDITSSTNINPTERQSNITNNTDSTNPINIKHSGNTCATNVTYPPLIVDQFSNQQQCPSTDPKPVINAQTTEKPQQQSFLVIKKISDPSVGGIVSYHQQHDNQSYHSHNQQQSSRVDYTLPMFDSRGKHDLVRTSSLLYDHLASSRTESTIRSYKKPTTRTIPGLKPIASAEKNSIDCNSHNSEFATMESTTATSSDGKKERCESGVLGIQSIEPAENQSYRKKPTKKKLERTHAISRSNCQEKCSNLLNALLASDHKSDTSSNCVGKSSRDNFNKVTSESIADRLYRRLSEDESCRRRAGNSTAKLAEHVKLEEAHLSAPPSTNLVQYKLTDDVEQNILITRPKSCPIVDAMVCDKRVMPRILMRNGRRSLDSLQVSHGINVAGYDVAAWKRFKSEQMDHIDECSNKSEHMDPSILDDTLTATEGECDDDDRDDGDDDEATDSPDDIDDEKMVSNIDMQVLEDFESAMMEVNQDDTAN